MESCSQGHGNHHVTVRNSIDEANPINFYPHPGCELAQNSMISPTRIPFVSPVKAYFPSVIPPRSPVVHKSFDSVDENSNVLLADDSSIGTPPFLDLTSNTVPTVGELPLHMQLKLAPAKPGVMPMAASVADILEALQAIQGLAQIANERITLAMEASSVKYFLKTAATLSNKYAYLYDMKSLCLSVEAVEDIPWKDLFYVKEREIVISTKLQDTTLALTNLCYTVKNIARDHPRRARKVQEQMMGLLARLAISTEKLVVGARSFTGDFTALGDIPYGKDIHLVSHIKSCRSDWRELRK